MIHWILTSLWESALAQFGIAGLVLAASIAVFLYVPAPGARHAATMVAAGCLVFLFLGPKFYIEGIRYEKAKWDAAEQAAAERASQARTEAEQEVAAEPAQPADTAAAAVSGGRHGLARFLPARRVRNDIYERHDR